MAEGIVEITARIFFTSDDLDVAPSASICFPIANIDKGNWPAILAELVEHAQDAVDGAPIKDLRPMTEDETAAYRAAERGD